MAEKCAGQPCKIGLTVTGTGCCHAWKPDVMKYSAGNSKACANCAKHPDSDAVLPRPASLFGFGKAKKGKPAKSLLRLTETEVKKE